MSCRGGSENDGMSGLGRAHPGRNGGENSMPKLARVIGCVLAVVGAAVLPLSPASAQSPAARMTAAAKDFLATLTPQQRQSVLYPFGDLQQRQRWSNLPKGLFERGGINLGAMTPVQRASALKLVASALSAKGYEKVQNILRGDDQKKLAQDNG